MNALQLMQYSAVGQTILASSPLYYGLLAVHAIGMAVIVGGAVMMSLRVPRLCPRSAC